MLIFAIFTVKSQVGVNTKLPKGEFHIDGNKDNTQSASIQMHEDDFVVKNDGKTGIGLITPTTKLHIMSSKKYSAFKLHDGTHRFGKILGVLNDQGDIVWKDRLATKIVRGEGPGPWGSSFTGSVDSDMKYIYRKVTLEPGVWMIRTNLLLETKNGTESIMKGFYGRFSWAECDNNGNNCFLSNDAVYGNNIGGPLMYKYGLATGQTIINNTSNNAKIYYLVTRKPTLFWGNYDPTTKWHNLGSEFNQETSIIAFPAN